VTPHNHIYLGCSIKIEWSKFLNKFCFFNLNHSISTRPSYQDVCNCMRSQLEVSNGLARPGPKRPDYINGPASPARLNYNWAAYSRARPDLCGPWASPARPIYFLLLKFIHFFNIFFYILVTHHYFFS
jgi:hypothetical protein